MFKLLYLRVANHELEVVIRVDAGAQVLVIVLELLDGDDLVALVRLPHGHEVGEHLVGRLSSALEIRMEAHIVSNANILNGHLAGAVLVKDAIGLVNHISSARVE